MTDRLRSERETQNRVIRLFQSLGYDYLGNWEKRPKNSAVEFAQLEAFLRKNGANSAQISAVMPRSVTPENCIDAQSNAMPFCPE